MPAIVPRKYDDMRREFWAECERLAELARVRYGRCLDPLYIVGKKEQGKDTHNPRLAIWTAFTLMTDYEQAKACNDDWQIVHGEHIPRNYPMSEYASWIKDRLYNEPIWIFAD